MPQANCRVLCLFMSILLLSWTLSGCQFSYKPYSPLPAAYSGNSDGCEATVIVPTLDSPTPQGKNVIWCGTFQLAYDKYKALPGPVADFDDQDVGRRLNDSRMNPSDLPDNSYYAAAGWSKDGIVRKIQDDMAKKFPQVKVNLPQEGIEAIGYAYLAAAVKFRTAYFDRENGDEFVDSSGHKTRVSSFGLYKQHDAGVNETLADQIQVLYAGGGDFQPSEFVLDLDRNSKPSQLILACVEPKETLAATWQDVQRKIQQLKPTGGLEKFSQYDTLAVPNTAYRIEHHFKELEMVKGRRAYGAFQMVDFRLDRSGAVLASEAYFASLAGGRHFGFTHPFLIVMRKRGSNDPYFVMWVDNAELLCKR